MKATKYIINDLNVQLHLVILFYFFLKTQGTHHYQIECWLATQHLKNLKYFLFININFAIIIIIIK